MEGILSFIGRAKRFRRQIVDLVNEHERLLNGSEEFGATHPGITEVVIAWRLPDGSFSYTTSEDVEDAGLALEILGEAIHSIEGEGDEDGD